ncbi:unnamed protein product [Calicophoron daubneyi]|uniref:TELO2-interacting protein 1 n=1 Tax=Calicophoron daubneyi TaxID=300641 RepID=A0AAV2TP82_CALDB
MFQNVHHAEDWEQAFSDLHSRILNCNPADLRALIAISHPSLRLFLQNTKTPKSDLIEKVYLIYSEFFKHQLSSSDSLLPIEVLDDLSVLLFNVSSDKELIRPWSALSEECCLAIVSALHPLFKYASHECCVRIYSRALLPLLSHICSTLLEMGEHCSWRTVRKKSLEVLQSMLLPDALKSVVHNRCQNALRVCVCQLFPGICQTLYRIITGDRKVGSSVKVAGLDTLAIVIAVLFKSLSKPDGYDNSVEADSSARLFSHKWYESTLYHLNQIVAEITDSLLHAQLELDFDGTNQLGLASVRCLSRILIECSEVLETDSGISLRNTVIGALINIASQNFRSCAENPVSSSSLARNFLDQYINASCQGLKAVGRPVIPNSLSGNLVIRKITIDTLFKHVASLPRYLLNSLDETLLQKRLRSIQGYLSVLDAEGLLVLATCRDFTHRLCASLADFLLFNMTAIELFTDPRESEASNSPQSVAVPISDWNKVKPCHLFPKSFESFRDPKTLALIQLIAERIAAEEKTIDIFLDTCRDIMLQGSDRLISSLLLITAGLAGYLSNESVEWDQRRRDNLRILGVYFNTELLQTLTPEFDLRERQPEPTSNSSVTVWNSLAHIVSKSSRVPLSEPFSEPATQKHPSTKEMKANTLYTSLLLELYCTGSQLYRIAPNISNLPSEPSEDFIHLGLLPCASLAAQTGLVGQTASRCLVQVAVNCGYSDTNEMITKNADFLISAITLELHRIILLAPVETATTCLPPDLLLSLQSSCRAMSILFQYANMEILPLLRPMVKQVLACLDITYEHQTGLFLPALKNLVITCRKWNDAAHNPTSVVSKSKRGETSNGLENMFAAVLANTNQLILETRRNHCFLACTGDTRSSHNKTDGSPNPKEEDNGASPEDEADACEDDQRIYPDQLHIVEEIMLRCIHLLAANEPRLRNLSMDILIEGCQTLSDESELLLPLVHKIWGSLVGRFRDKHAIVVEKAFQLLTALSNVAGEFIRARASSDIIPPLVNFLNRGASVSSSATDSYRHLTAYRVQHDLLEKIGLFCLELGLASESLKSVVQMLARYLEEGQPVGLQEASIQSVKILWRLDPGLIWSTFISAVKEERRAEIFTERLKNGFCAPQFWSFSADAHLNISAKLLKPLLSGLLEPNDSDPSNQ